MMTSTWIAGTTALASMVKAWKDARVEGLDLIEAKLRVHHGARPAAGKPHAVKERATANLAIHPTLLAALVGEMNSAVVRFSAVFNDPRYTPADIDREQERAKDTVCTHIRKIMECNGGVLPNEILRKLSRWFQSRSDYPMSSCPTSHSRIRPEPARPHPADPQKRRHG